MLRLFDYIARLLDARTRERRAYRMLAGALVVEERRRQRYDTR
jgi:hypothetical protein